MTETGLKMMILNPGRLMMAMGAFAFVSLTTCVAADTNSPAAVSPAPTAPVAASPAVSLPYGAGDIVKLGRAQVNEDIILNYVRNSGTIYSLSSREIVELKNQGVSDRVINAMLDQSQRAPGPAVATPAPAPQSETTPASVPNASAPVVTPPNTPPADALTAPPAPSSVYVIPATPAPPYYYYYPYYPYAYGPAVSFGFRFGAGWGGGWRSGWGHGGHHHR